MKRRLIAILAVATFGCLTLTACEASIGVGDHEPGYVLEEHPVYTPSTYDSSVYVVRGAPATYYSSGGYYHNDGGVWYYSDGPRRHWVRRDAPHAVVSVHGHIGN